MIQNLLTDKCIVTQFSQNLVWKFKIKKAIRMLHFKTLLFSLFFITLSASAYSNDDILNQIAENGEIKICYWPGYYKISYRNPYTNELEGLDIDLAYTLAQELNVKPNFIESSFPKLKDNMKNNVCQISMHGVGIREDRKEFMDFSDPHLASGIYGISDKSNEAITQWKDIDKAGHVVVLLKGSYMVDLMTQQLKNARIKIVSDFKAREQEVLSGRADVFITDYPYGMRMINFTDWAKLLTPEAQTLKTPYAFAIPLNQQKWLDYVNSFVRKIKADGRLLKAAEKHGLTAIVEN